MSQHDVHNMGISGPSNTVQNDVKDTEKSGGSHKMSIALTIGATIGLIGLILLLYGLFGNADYSHSDGININLWWGLLMVVFGLILSTGGYLSSRRNAGR